MSNSGLIRISPHANRIHVAREQLLDEFDRLWQRTVRGGAPRPSLSSFLLLVPESEQSKMLELLGSIECECRLRLGETIQPERDYPELAVPLQELLESLLDKPAEQTTLKSQKPNSSARQSEPRAARCHTPSRRIGPYKLLQKLGEGGMGEVWMAEQTEPVRRRVALKLIKAGLDNQQVLARFEAERQALAMMDHQNIARVLDADMTSDGVPYFVMELVQGIPFNQFCDQRALSVKERLELFLPVCSAVQHAHQKGIIHRDLKPSNVLVCLYDGHPVPKVIDFGLAKALQSAAKLTEKTMFTEFGQVVGTLQYMSPEQAELNQLDVDTRTDIYSLGVMLYEILTGSTPIETETLREQAMLEVLRTIREQEPPRPSARLSNASKEAAKGISQQRRIDPVRLKKILRGELDWIVMKALEIDRTRRYETASGFGRDISRYLQGEVVTARPPSATYRVTKYVRRHKGLVASLVSIFLLLLGGVAGTSIAMLRAWEAEASAKEGKRQLEIAFQQGEQERARAERHLEVARKGIDLLGTVFTELDPRSEYETLGELRDALSCNLMRAISELEGLASAEPLELAELKSRLAHSLIGLGEYSKASATLEAVHQLRQSELGAQHSKTQESGLGLAEAYIQVGKAKEAIPLLERIVEERTDELGSKHPDTLKGKSLLAEAYRKGGDLERALPLLEQTLLDSQGSKGQYTSESLVALHNLAEGYRETGETDKARSIYEKVLPLLIEGFGPDYPGTLVCMNNLAQLYTQSRELEKARDLHEQILSRQQQTLGKEHPHTLASLNLLASVYSELGEHDRALPLLEQSVSSFRASLGTDHPNTLTAMNNLGRFYWLAKQFDKSVPMFEEVVKLREAALGREHPETKRAVANLGVNYLDAGRTTEAIAVLEEAWSASSRIKDLGWIQSPLRRAYLADDRREAFEKLAEQVLQRTRSESGPDSVEHATALVSIGKDYLSSSQWQRAGELLSAGLEIRQRRQPGNWSTFNVQSLLGGAKLAQAVTLGSEAEGEVKAKLLAEAELLLVQGYVGMKQLESTIPPQGNRSIPEALDRLLELYTALKRPEEVAKYREVRAVYSAPGYGTQETDKGDSTINRPRN